MTFMIIIAKKTKLRDVQESGISSYGYSYSQSLVISKLILSLRRHLQKGLSCGHFIANDKI